MYLYELLNNRPYLIDGFKEEFGGSRIDELLEREGHYKYISGFSVMVNPNSWIPEDGECFYIAKNMQKDIGILEITLLKEPVEDSP